MVRPIEIVVKTQWEGKVAVRQQYITQAQHEYKDLVIIHDRGSMRIPFAELDKYIVGKTEMTFRDKFRRNKRGYLYYFNWKPDVNQGVLI